MYENGEGLPAKDLDQAFYWFELAAQGGDLQAQACLADWLEGGAHHDPERAAPGGRGGGEKASQEETEEKENKGAMARNTEQAFVWRLRAARMGDPESQFHVGRMLAQGKGTPRNIRLVRMNLLLLLSGLCWRSFLPLISPSPSLSLSLPPLLRLASGGSRRGMVAAWLRGQSLDAFIESLHIMSS